MKDKYDKAVEFLVCNPHQIQHFWNLPTDTGIGCLFRMAARLSPLYTWPPIPNGCMLGCLTQVRANEHYSGIRFVAHTPELTEEIRNDVRIPKHPSIIDCLQPDAIRETLNVFAEWQRRLDRELSPA